MEGRGKHVIRENHSSNSIKFSNKNRIFEESKDDDYNKTQKPDDENLDSSFEDNDNRKSENLSPMK